MGISVTDEFLKLLEVYWMWGYRTPYEGLSTHTQGTSRTPVLFYWYFESVDWLDL